MDGLANTFGSNLARRARTLKQLDESSATSFKIQCLSEDAVHTSAIEGESLNQDSIRDSLLHRFGFRSDAAKCPPAESGIADLTAMVNRDFDCPITHETLCDWHLSLLSHSRRINTLAAYRSREDEPVVVASQSHVGSDIKVHFEAPPGNRVMDEMAAYVTWFNHATDPTDDPQKILQVAARCHSWFETIHPFEDGNGRIGRALIEKAISRMIERPSLIPVAAQINADRKGYYDALNVANQYLDITTWLSWFARMAVAAQERGDKILACVLVKSAIQKTLGDSLNSRQQKVLHRLFSAEPDGFAGGLSAKNHRTITGVAEITAARDLAELVEAGVLTRTGRARATRFWLVIPEIDVLLAGWKPQPLPRTRNKGVYR